MTGPCPRRDGASAEAASERHDASNAQRDSARVSASFNAASASARAPSRGSSAQAQFAQATSAQATARGPSAQGPSQATSARGPSAQGPIRSLRGARLLRALEVPVLVAVPVALAWCAVAQIDGGALLTVVVVFAALSVFFASFEASRPTLRQIMPTVVLAALAAAGRVLFAPIPDFKPVSAICILAGAVFGRRSGFLVGALAALVSNFFFGQGPWTPWQMYSWGLVGYSAGVLADRGWLDKPPVLYAYGFLSAMLYGLFLNGWTVIGFVHPLTLPAAALSFAAAFPFDFVHGAATIVFLAALYKPWRRKLERIKRKYALIADSPRC